MGIYISMREHHRSFRVAPHSGGSRTAGDATSPTRISSESTFYYKRVFPVVWFGFLTLFFCIGLGTGIAQNKPAAGSIPSILVILLLAAGGYALNRITFDLMDEVWDAGSHLVVKNRGREERIALDDVISVNYVGYMNPPRVTLRLANPRSLEPRFPSRPPSDFSISRCPRL